ncbi:ATP-grasp domain-containing protein [Salicibibacter cibarius]|uniref:biotin carboxylase n=1 Tax=Salicibibacter cibarius TaxID=2743000 RepID=A0A7T7CC24_9BACI|nr:biotin carboxylase N-terminal domain-containing protein [Salicibibacter cibarius]QQK76559.1 ATP-grasp domain-containing protein [Salicibibacter cibarius]
MKKILIANRGEIAKRVIITCEKLGLESVVVYSQADKNLPYIREATVAYEIGEPPAEQSYLNQEKILDVAKKENVDAIHPGYGFLSEHAGFVRAVEEAGITFIGPDAEVVEMMGDKVSARQMMQSAGVPVVPGSGGTVSDIDEAAKIAGDIGYPVMLKASAGGGGIGMQRCETEEELRKAFTSNQKRAQAYFGDSGMFVEKMIENGRHIEVQIFGDTFGSVVHLYERDCSIQRRNQKVIEESPSPFLSEATKEKMLTLAKKAAQHVGYVNAGTIEFIVDHNENFYFLEMNTRLQVEHPVTEMTTELDLVEWQIKVANGERLPLNQDDFNQKGHAIEFRLYAEDPKRFLPSPGDIEAFIYPEEQAGVRVDTGMESGTKVTHFYDPMIAKIIVSGSNRRATVENAKQFFSCLELSGIKNNAPLFEKILLDDNFIRGNYTTTFLQNL